jgi:drug/metabolite transporter (DMT)-like permease
LAYLALLIGSLGLGFSGIFVKWANVGGAVSGFYRVAIAATTLAIPFGIAVRQRRPAARRHVLLAALGGLFFAGDLITWNTSVLLTSVASATLFGNTSPLWVSLGALLLFKEKLGRGFWLGLSLALLGVVIIVSENFASGSASGLGSLLALVAGAFYAAFFLCAQRAREGLSSLTAWWISTAASALALLVAALALGQPLIGYSAFTYWNLIGVALVTQVGAYLAINYALGHLPASIVSPTLLGQPVLTAVLAWPLLGQPITPPQIIGGLIVLSGIWVVHRQRRSA